MKEAKVAIAGDAWEVDRVHGDWRCMEEVRASISSGCSLTPRGGPRVRVAVRSGGTSAAAYDMRGNPVTQSLCTVVAAAGRAGARRREVDRCAPAPVLPRLACRGCRLALAGTAGVQLSFQAGRRCSRPVLNSLLLPPSLLFQVPTEESSQVTVAAGDVDAGP